jgi:RHS repeat-associated protein
MGSWNGTVLVDKADAAGTYYRRNRTYDPSTARFTQEDPIGLAGGMNEYGFASGDPVTYSDPFGLCPPKDKNTTDCRGFHEEGITPAPFSPIDLIPVGAAVGGVRALLVGAADRVAGSAGARVLANKVAGDAFRDEIAGLFEKAGYGVRTEVYKRTPFGKRFIDIEISRDGTVLGGIETKFGKSTYTAYQRAKDAALKVLEDYNVQVVRPQ